MFSIQAIIGVLLMTGVALVPTEKDIIRGIIKGVSEDTGVSYHYLLRLAEVESSLDVNAQARTSSAVGLFQFVEKTWFRMLKMEGERLKMADITNALEWQKAGYWVIKDQALRSKALELRKDPIVSTFMAAMLTKDNASILLREFNVPVSAGDLYVAHFLGIKKTIWLKQLLTSYPKFPAASFAPVAAHANPKIFYDSAGKSRTCGELYRNLVWKFSDISEPLGKKG